MGVAGPQLAPAASGTTQFSSGQDSVAAVLADLDFDDPLAVSAAHARLSQPLALERLCTRVFDGVNLDGVRRALATPILYRCADE